MEVTNLKIYGLYPYSNKNYEGIAIEWNSDAGWGTCDIYHSKNGGPWRADTEHMGRDFVKNLLNEVVDWLEVVE